MIDLTDANSPRYYKYVVPDSAVSQVRLEQFAELGSSDLYVRNETGDNTILERLVFLVDYVGTDNSVASGRISLVYDDAKNKLGSVLNPVKKIVNIGEDTTRLTATAVYEGRVANSGSFSLNMTVNSSTPNVNTAYEDDMYAIKLSFDNRLPDGSYAEVDGNRYYSNNGCITVYSLASGEFTLDLYSPLPLTLNDGKATLTATLLPAVSSSAPGSDAKSATVVFNCIDVQACAIDADILDNIFTPGRVYQTDVTLRYAKIDSALLTVSKKTEDGIYSELFGNVSVGLPTADNTVTVTLGNGIDVVSGETYIFSFVGYVDCVPVCSDECYIVGGYE